MNEIAPFTTLGSAAAGVVSRLAAKMRERFETFYIPEPNSGCWIWTGGLSKGYGMFHLDGPRQMKAHRFSWTVHRGQIPDGMQVCHSCDMPSCVNPEHLFLGTHQDNMADRKQKGRTTLCGASGEANGTKTRPDKTHRGEQIVQSKLSEDEVRAIRSDKRLFRIIAEDYGVSLALISLIKNRKIWCHVD